MDYLIKNTRTHARWKIYKKNRWKIRKFRTGSWEMFKRLGTANTKNAYEQDYLFSVTMFAINSIALSTKSKNFQFYYIKRSRDKDRMCAAERTCYVSSGNWLALNVYFHRAPNSLWRGSETNEAYVMRKMVFHSNNENSCNIYLIYQFTLFCPAA